ncbi:hypothetical protein L1S34_09750 [Flavobacterium sp. K77]|uniref:hypothetical protein n=1 Tax=Flavobacterium sp. K77 TaxID=2910676 RepID=UPI001F3F8FCB|nr:hypothetical protein [Flavobacterium sp. K77]MCF6141567.1 hypothetical protein [Flavobacterium sp. K77]
MKNLSFLFCLLALQTLYSQQIYKFDYEIKYQYNYATKNYNDIRSYLINSKDNSYFAVKIPIRKNKYKLIVQDYNGLRAEQVFKLEEFEKPSLLISLFNAASFTNKHKNIINDYDFNNHDDTIIDGNRLKNIRLSATNKKLKENKNVGQKIYLVDPKFNFLPLLALSTEYEIWQARTNFPNGLLMRSYFLGSDNKIINSFIFKEIIQRNFTVNYYNYIPKKN